MCFFFYHDLKKLYVNICLNIFFFRATLPLGESSNDCEVHCPYYNVSGM